MAKFEEFGTKDAVLTERELRKVPAWRRWAYKHDQARERPTTRVLTRWRKEAILRARRAGGATACGLCKRPMGQIGQASVHPWGLLDIYAPTNWHRKSYRRRRLCYICWLRVIDKLEEWEATLFNEHLPPERAGSKGVVDLEDPTWSEAAWRNANGKE